MKQLLTTLTQSQVVKGLNGVQFSTEEQTPKTYTQEEVDLLKAEVAKNSFEAGKSKAGLTKEQLEEYNTLRTQAAEAKEKETFSTLLSNLKGDELKDTGLKATSVFAKQYSSRLKDLEGKKLSQEVNKIKTELETSKNEEELEAFFGTSTSTPDSSLATAKKLGEQTETKGRANDFYPGTTIRKPR